MTYSHLIFNGRNDFYLGLISIKVLVLAQFQYLIESSFLAINKMPQHCAIVIISTMILAMRAQFVLPNEFYPQIGTYVYNPPLVNKLLLYYLKIFCVLKQHLHFQKFTNITILHKKKNCKLGQIPFCRKMQNQQLKS